MNQTSGVRRPARHRMVRKQVYIFTHQEARLEALAQEQVVSEAGLIRRAVDAFLEQPQPDAVRHLPPDDAAWQDILASFAAVRARGASGEPHQHQWTRDEYYDDSRHRRIGE